MVPCPRPFLNLRPNAELTLAFAFCFCTTLANGRYDLNIKKALRAAGGAGFEHPYCLAYAYAPGQAYTGGEQVSYNG